MLDKRTIVYIPEAHKMLPPYSIFVAVSPCVSYFAAPPNILIYKTHEKRIPGAKENFANAKFFVSHLVSHFTAPHRTNNQEG